MSPKALKARRTRVRAHKEALGLFDAAKALIEAKGSHGRFYAHRDLLRVVRYIQGYKRLARTSK